MPGSAWPDKTAIPGPSGIRHKASQDIQISWYFIKVVKKIKENIKKSDIRRNKV